MKSKDSSLLYISFIQTPSLICPVPFLLSLLFPHWMTSPFLHVPFYIYASTLEHPTMFFNTEKSELPLIPLQVSCLFFCITVQNSISLSLKIKAKQLLFFPLTLTNSVFSTEKGLKQICKKPQPLLPILLTKSTCKIWV